MNAPRHTQTPARHQQLAKAHFGECVFGKLPWVVLLALGWGILGVEQLGHSTQVSLFPLHQP